MIIDSVFAADLPKLPDVSDDWARSRLYDFVAALDRLELSSAGADAPDHI